MGSVLVNGEPVAIPDHSSDITLLDFLRARGLTGCKEGCAEGECGACAVAVVGERGTRSTYRVVNSCLMLLSMAAGREVYTVEGLAASGTLTEPQEAMAAAGGSQCGYCTPGFVMSLFAEQHRPDRNGPCDPLALSGNLCRCTGYRPIRDAAASLGAPAPGPFLDRLERPAAPLQTMSADGFARPDSLDSCLHLLSAHPQAQIIAGGTDLVVDFNHSGRLAPLLVSLDGLPELRMFSIDTAAVTIGAALPLGEVAERWGDAPEFWNEWLTLFGSPLIRNRATLGGNLATASPIGDAAPLLLALDARLHLASVNGRRIVGIDGFYRGYRQTALRQGELITAIEIPRPIDADTAFYKIAKRRMDDISTAAAAISVTWDDRNTVTRARFCFGGVAAVPLRLAEAEAVVVGRPWEDAAVERVQQVIAGTLKPLSDHRGSKEYRLDVCCALVQKFRWEHRR